MLGLIIVEFNQPRSTPLDPCRELDHGERRDHDRTRCSEFKALCERAGIPPYRVHDLRHTAATLLIAQGQHARVIMEVLGHSQIAVTMNVYGHVMDSQLRGAADAVTEALWGNAEEQ